MEEQIMSLELEKSKVSVSHILHLIATLLTGFWGLIWIIACIMASNKKKKIEQQIMVLRMAQLKDRNSKGA